MANWHFIFPYGQDAADWLASEGWPHPPVRLGNRLPTWAEVERAVQVLGISPDAPLVIVPSADGESLLMRGDLLLELRVVRWLTEFCGQQWVYPDCGSPAIVIDASSSPELIAKAWLSSLDAEDSWRSFYLQDRST